MPSPRPMDARPTHWRHPVDEDRRRRRASRHTWRRVLAVAAAVLFLGGYLYWREKTGDENVEAYAEDYLEALLGTRVTIDEAHFDFAEGLILRGITVDAPAPFTAPLLVAERVELRINPVALLRMRLDVAEIRVHRPVVALELWNETSWNFQQFARAGPTGGLPVRPVVSLEEGTLWVRRLRDGTVTYEHALQIGGLLIPAEADPDVVRFQTDLTSRGGLRLAVTSGRLSARTGALSFEGRASNVALTPDLREGLPREVKQVWDWLEPSGSVNLEVHFDPDAGLVVRMILAGVTFAHEIAGDLHRFENLTGLAVLSRDGLVLEDVQGVLRGTVAEPPAAPGAAAPEARVYDIPVRLAGTVTGFDADRLGLDLAVRAEGIALQDHRRHAADLAPRLGRLYDDFDPAGRIDLDIRVRRAPRADAPLDVAGTAHCRGITLTYRRFPYTLTEARGRIDFGPDGYSVPDLAGRHGRTAVTVSGVVTNPGPDWGCEYHIVARDMRLDEDLRQALTPAHRARYDQFRPAGLVDLEATVVRRPDRAARLRTTVTATLRDCTAAYEGFPYEVRGATGTVVIGPERTEIREVRGTHDQAAVELAGTVAWQADGPATVHLDVAVRGVRLGGDLFDALPEAQRDALRTFHLAGRADVRGTVDYLPRAETPLDYDLAVDLRGARMIYEEFPFLAEDVTGTARVTPGRVQLQALQGFNAGAGLAATGWIRREVDSGDYAMDLDITGTDLPLSEALRGALGPDMRAAWSHLNPDGRVDVEARVWKDLGADRPVQHHVWVTARDLAVRFDFFPYPLEHVEGRLEFTGREVRLHDVTARTGPTAFALGGRVVYEEGGGTAMDLTVRAEGLRLGGPLRRAVPEAVRTALDRLDPTGRLDLALDRLTYRRDPDGHAVAEWHGEALLDEVTLDPGVEVTDVVGTLGLTGRAEGTHLALDGEFWIQRGRIADKPVDNMRLVFTKAPDADQLNFSAIEGAFYGGLVEGRAAVSLRPGGGYAFRLALKDADFQRLAKHGFGLEGDLQGGRLEGTLVVRGGGPGQALDARGTLHVSGAALYELPMIVRVLAALRLQPAERAAFREATVQYYLRAGRVLFSDLRLEGPALSLYGAGTVEPDGTLDLTFMTGRKDDQPLLATLSELLEGVRRELGVVRVTGTRDAPVVEFQTLPAVTAPLREFLRLVREARTEVDAETAP